MQWPMPMQVYLMAFLLDASISILIGMAIGSVAGMLAAWLSGRARVVTGGILGGAAGTILNLILRNTVLFDYLERYPDEPFWDTRGYIDVGTFVACAAGTGLMGSLAWLSLGKDTSKPLRRKLQASLAVAAIAASGFLAYELFFSPRIDATELAAFKLVENIDGGGHQGFNEVASLAFSPDGKLLASGCSNEGSVRLWDVDQKKELATLIPATKSRTMGPDARVLFAPDGKVLATICTDRRTLGAPGLKLWEVPSGKEIASLDSGRFLAFTPDGKTLLYAPFPPVTPVSVLGLLGSPMWQDTLPAVAALGNWRPGLVLWDSRNDTKRTIANGDHVDSVAFSPDGKTLAGIHDLEVKLWDVETGKELGALKGHSLDLRKLQRAWSRFPLEGIFFVGFSADSKRLHTVNSHQIKVWDVSEKQERLSIAYDADAGMIRSVAYSPQSNLLAVGSGKLHPKHVNAATPNEVKLWDLSTGKNLASLPHLGVIDSVAFTANGKTLVSLLNFEYHGGQVRLWDVATGRRVASVTCRHWADLNYSFAVTPDGKRMAVGGLKQSEPPSCGDIRLFDLVSVNRPAD